MSPVSNGSRDCRLKWQMFGLSFTALFLEMMVIRWVPSVVHLVAYYANLMLLSSFLGLGVGALAADRKWRLFDWFPVFLACEITTQLLCRNVELGSSSSEMRFYALGQSSLHAVILVGVFAANALLFVPLGQRMGVLFNALPRLSAYAWDLGGSLCGTLAFGLFSLSLFSPVLGLGIVMAVFLVLQEPRGRWISTPIFAALLLVMELTGDPAAIWSPYYHITVSRIETPDITESGPPPNLRTMRNPPIYGVSVNQFSYHLDAALDLSRYDPGSAGALYAAREAPQYGLPYVVSKGRDRVLIVGSGGGSDVEAALAAGVGHVDAVEIDPVIIRISQRFNAGAPYSDAKVTVHTDDARSYFKKANPGYDLVVFGYLDSQALFSSMSTVRLDGYVYTVESLRSAYALLNEHGVLSLSFYLGADWLGPKLYDTVARATGQQPIMYMTKHHMVLVVPKDLSTPMPASIGHFQRAAFVEPPKLELPTDDWPFLYLKWKTIPSDYLVVIGSLLAFSIAAVAGLRRGSFGRLDLHFALMGMGFLLLETKSISDCTLFFGATWLVTLIVVTGVLLMVFAANRMADRLGQFSFLAYLPLFAVLAVLLAVPREAILGFDLPIRLLWALGVVPLPIFFAGIIFSTTFRDAASGSAVFGANLIGAMCGGFCEYLGMAVGNHQLSILVAVAYLGSLAALYGFRRAAG